MYYPDYMSLDMGKDQSESGLIALRDRFENFLIKKVLISNGWNKTKSAEDLKISRAYLFTLIKKHRLNNNN